MLIRKLTKRFILNSIDNLNLSAPIRYERYYINDKLRIQKKSNTFEKELLDDNNAIIEKVMINEKEFEKLKSQSYCNIIRDNFLYLDDNRISIKKYHDDYKGLLRIEISFSTEKEMNDYVKEEWMGAEITNTPLAFDKYLSKLTKEEFKSELEKYQIT